jgi:hypothetical protein
MTLAQVCDPLTQGICACDVCCNIDNGDHLDLTGKDWNDVLYPETSKDGLYTIVNGTDGVQAFQFVFPYMDRKGGIEYELAFLSDTPLDCSKSFLFYKNYERRYPLVPRTYLTHYACETELSGLFTEEELKEGCLFYVALYKMVGEGSTFNMTKLNFKLEYKDVDMNFFIENQWWIIPLIAFPFMFLFYFFIVPTLRGKRRRGKRPVPPRRSTPYTNMF